MALTKSDINNFRGELFVIGQNQTPFLNVIGGLNGGARIGSVEFATSVTANTNAASQNVKTEDASVNAGTPTTYAKTQNFNTTQIMKNDAAVSFVKGANNQFYGGLNNEQDGSRPDSLSFQKEMALLQMAKDIDYSFIQGTYVKAVNTATAAKTRGILEATVSNAIAAAGANLDKAIMDSLLKLMFNSGSPFQEPILMCGADQKVKISNIYGFAPTDRNIGGINIQQIETDFGLIGVLLEPNMPSDSVSIAEASVCNPVFNPVVFDGESAPSFDQVNGQDVLWVRTGTVGASFGGFYYSQIGLDYGAESWHGKITGLAV